MSIRRILATVSAVYFLVCKCPAAIMDNISGYWPFDETSGGVAHESSGKGLNGSLVNFPGGQGNWVDGKIGGALQFGGLATQQYVRVDDYTKPTTALTISAWVWADSMPQDATIAANWNGLFIDYGLWGSSPYLSLCFGHPDPQGIGGSCRNEDADIVLPLSLGQWHYVAVVVDLPGGRFQFWRDGQDAGLSGAGGTFLPAPLPYLNIAGEPSNGNTNQGYWDGKIDDLALWTRALSDKEISSIYNAGLNGQPLISLVPEPSTLVLATVGCGVLIAERFRRGRRRSSAYSN